MGLGKGLYLFRLEMFLHYMFIEYINYIDYILCTLTYNYAERFKNSFPTLCNTVYPISQTLIDIYLLTFQDIIIPSLKLAYAFCILRRVVMGERPFHL